MTRQEDRSMMSRNGYNGHGRGNLKRKNRSERAPVPASAPASTIRFVPLGYDKGKGQLYVIWASPLAPAPGAPGALGAPACFARTRRELRNEWLRRISYERPELVREEPPSLADVSAKIDRDRNFKLEPNAAGPGGESLTLAELEHFWVHARILPTAEGLAALRAGTWDEHVHALAEAARLQRSAAEPDRVVLCASLDCKEKTTAKARYCEACKAIRDEARREREAHGQ
jgi:hypothetical protein